MSGTDRVRYCPECRLNVYNFSAMNPAEIKALVSAKTGRLCARFYQRADGTILTRNCPVGFRGALLRATRLASVSLSAIIALSQPKPARSQVQSSRTLVQIQPALGELDIEVTDPLGAVIANARIEVFDERLRSSVDTFTNEVGQAKIKLLPGSSYTLTVSIFGFTPRVLKHLQAPDSTGLTIRMELAVAVMGEIVDLPNLELEAAPTPQTLTLPDQPEIPSISRPKVNHNALQRFFSKLRHIF
jgi:hypothetical protein